MGVIHLTEGVAAHVGTPGYRGIVTPVRESSTGPLMRFTRDKAAKAARKQVRGGVVLVVLCTLYTDHAG
jgi:hypothetical protein